MRFNGAAAILLPCVPARASISSSQSASKTPVRRMLSGRGGVLCCHGRQAIDLYECPLSDPGMAAHMELDETLCRTVVCQHPQCWVTFRRIEHGQPRYRPLGAVTRMPSLDQAGGLPVLSVTTIPVTPTPSPHQDKQQPNMSAIMSSSADYNRYNSATYSMDKILFPGENSYREIPEATKKSAPRSSRRKPHQVMVMDSCLQDLQSKSRTMVWVPNTQQKLQKRDISEKPLKVQVTELTFTDVLTRSKRRENQDPDVPRSRRLYKPPTGGCPQNLSLSNSPILTRSYMRKWTTPSSGKNNTEGTTRSRAANECWPDSDELTESGLDGALLENRRMILHNITEKHQQSSNVSTSSPVYRMDEQYDTMDNLEIDFKSIKNQYYLWKKYITLAGPSHRIKPPDHKLDKGQRSHTLRTSRQVGNIGLFPFDLASTLSFYKQPVPETPAGSTDCDTERSHDMNNRNSPSLAGFSQTSFSETEQSNTPSECGSGSISEQGFPEEGKEAEAEQPAKDEDTAQTTPDQEPGRAFESEMPATNGPEKCDGQESPGQTAASPQPQPPPPSPMQ